MPQINLYTPPSITLKLPQSALKGSAMSIFELSGLNMDDSELVTSDFSKSQDSTLQPGLKRRK